MCALKLWGCICACLPDQGLCGRQANKLINEMCWREFNTFISSERSSSSELKGCAVDSEMMHKDTGW